MKIEDAIKRYESWAEDDRIDVLIRNEHRQIADWLKELNAGRPQGEWIDLDTKGEWWADAYKCPFCGCVTMHYHFCPNCGARMKGADDDNDNI